MRKKCSICMALAAILASTTVSAQAQSKDENFSVFYSQDERKQQLATGNEFFARTKRIGVKGNFRFLGRTCEATLFHETGKIEVLGQSKNSLCTDLNTHMEESLDYEGRVDFSMSDLWNYLNVKPSPTTTVELPMRNGKSLQVPAEGVRRYLADRAKELDYQIPPEAIKAGATSLPLTPDLFLGLIEDIDVAELLQYVQSTVETLASDPRLQEYLDELRTRLEDLKPKIEEWKIQYEELARSYIEMRGDYLDGEYEARANARMRGFADLRFDISRWRFSLETKKTGGYLAFPVSLTKRSKLKLGLGMARKTTYSVFQIDEIWTHLRGGVEVDVSGELQKDGETLYSDSFHWNEEVTLDERMDFSNRPFLLESPEATYLLYYVGAGYYHDNGSKFEVRLGLDGKHVDEATLEFSQKISKNISLQLGADYQKLAANIEYTNAQVPNLIDLPEGVNRLADEMGLDPEDTDPELVDEEDLERVNEDVEPAREFVVRTNLRFGILIGDRVAVKLADIFLAGPLLSYQTGLDVRFNRFMFNAAVIKYMYLLPGSINSIDVGALRVGPYRLDQVFPQGNFRGHAKFPDDRIDQTLLRFGFGMNPLPRMWVMPSLDFEKEKVQSVNIRFRQEDFLRKNMNLDAGVRIETERGEIGTVWLKWSFSPGGK